MSNKPYIYSHTNVITDRSEFPYPYFWRGDYRSTKPIVYDREAGFAPRTPDRPTVHPPDGCVYYPNHCFEPAPSTQYPCYPECTRPVHNRNPYLMRHTKLYMYR
jgi:hypothetical protein